MAVVDGPDVREVETPHGTVRVRDTGGPGTPLLLVHSLLVDPDLYAEVVPLLAAAGHRCLVPELPLGGHGTPLLPGADLSPPGLARLLVEVLDALDVEQAHVVGVDTGGALTQLLMAQHRERVGLVVLTGCDAYEHFPPRTLLGLALRPLFWPGGLLLTSQLTRVALVRRLLVLRPITHRGVADAVLVRWTAPLRRRAVRRDLQAAWRGMQARHTLAAAAANRDFPRPVLVAWGDDDRLFARHLAERLVRDLPQAVLTTLPDCAAFAAVDQPQLLADLVDRHVRAGSRHEAVPTSRSL